MKIYTDVENIPFEHPIDRQFVDGYYATRDRYQFRLTEHLKKLIDKTNNEGLKKQFLPGPDEVIYSKTEFHDVADEVNFSPVTGITHRYPNKVLLNLTLNCPTYCRFCFRKEKLNDPANDKFLTAKQIETAIQYIRDNQIDEVILSGGDPFFCNDDLLGHIVDHLLTIPKVTLVRYHTRYFTFDPTRITLNLVSRILQKKTSLIVMHINQVEEITPEMEESINICVDNGIPLFTQTALLKGVNDNHESLKNLFTSLIRLRVKPYYLFHSDPGHGLSHFRVKLQDGISLYKSLYDRISGLAMPIYLFNVPGGYGHSILDLGNLRQVGDGVYEMTTWKGERVTYHDY